MEANIITIGDEILIGQVIDTNSAWIAQQLNAIGISVQSIESIEDSKNAIQDSVERLFKKNDLIICTGGLGPTLDDITKSALAEYFGMELLFHKSTYDRIEQLLAKFKRTPTKEHHQQSFMPDGARLFENQMGTAPGMWFQKDEKVLISLPGVPYEMKSLLEGGIFDSIKTTFKTTPIYYRTIMTAGEGESRIADKITTITSELPSNIKIAFLPSLATVRLRLSAKGENALELKNQIDQYVDKISDIIPELVYGYDDTPLEESVANLFNRNNLKLGLAESCTGGAIASRITGRSGASSYFKGGIVAYDNLIKENLLQVSSETLKKWGAVSEETVKEMVQGTLTNLGVDIALAVSGIAGPSGGTPEKPVGTIFFAVGDAKNIKTYKISITKDRLKNIEYASNFALNVIRKFLIAR